MKITRKEAIRECKRLWHEIEKSGLSKYEFMNMTSQGLKWLEKDYDADCPLCDYSYSINNCYECPLFSIELPDFLNSEEYCYQLGYNGSEKPSQKWLKAIYNLKE